MAQKNNSFASVLAFEKKFVPSDGYMYSTNWEERNAAAVPVKLVERPPQNGHACVLKLAERLCGIVPAFHHSVVFICALGEKL